MNKLLYSCILFFIILLFCGLSPAPKEDRFMIGVVDTGINFEDPRVAPYLCSYGHKDFTGEGINDTHGHGTHVVSLIVANAEVSHEKFCVVILKFYTEKDDGNMYRSIKAFDYAINYLKLKLVNFSGYGEVFSAEEAKLIRDAPHTLFVVAAGNQNMDVVNGKQYPAALPYKNVIVVGAINKKGQKVKCSNYGPRVNMWELGENVLGWDIMRRGYMGLVEKTGTSMSTAIHTGKIIKRTIKK